MVGTNGKPCVPLPGRRAVNGLYVLCPLLLLFLAVVQVVQDGFALA